MEAEIAKTARGMTPAQRRASARIKLQVPVFLRGTDAAGSEFIELTKSLNISATGVCVTSTHILRQEQMLHLTVPAPSPSSSSVVPKETPPMAARVVRQDALGDLRLFGLEFLVPID